MVDPNWPTTYWRWSSLLGHVHSDAELIRRELGVIETWLDQLAQTKNDSLLTIHTK